MKKVLLSGVVAFATVAAVAQSTSIVGKADVRPLKNGISAPYNEQPTIFAPEAQNGNMDKDGPTSFYISYADYNTTDAQPGTLGGGRYRINSNFAVSDSDMTSAMISLRPYVGFTDFEDIEGTYTEINPAAPGAKLRIDSLTIVLGHSNSSGSTNKLYASLRSSTAGNFGSLGQLYYPNNTVLWRDSIITSTSLSPSGSAFGTNSTYVWDMAPNYLHTLSNTSHVGVRFDAFLAPGDTCGISGYYKQEGGTILAPEIYNSFALFSDSPGSIFVIRANWYIIAKVTYTSNASVSQLETNGFTIHNLMPNPAKDFSNIRYELKNAGDVRFIITDMAGKQISQVQINGQAGTSDYQLNTADLASGYYNVSMVVNGQVFTQKLNVVK